MWLNTYPGSRVCIIINAGMPWSHAINWSALISIDRHCSVLKGISDQCYDFDRHWSLIKGVLCTWNVWPGLIVNAFIHSSFPAVQSDKLLITDDFIEARVVVQLHCIHFGSIKLIEVHHELAWRGAYFHTPHHYNNNFLEYYKKTQEFNYDSTVCLITTMNEIRWSVMEMKILLFTVSTSVGKVVAMQHRWLIE